MWDIFSSNSKRVEGKRRHRWTASFRSTPRQPYILPYTATPLDKHTGKALYDVTQWHGKRVMCTALPYSRRYFGSSLQARLAGTGGRTSFSCIAGTGGRASSAGPRPDKSSCRTRLRAGKPMSSNSPQNPNHPYPSPPNILTCVSEGARHTIPKRKSHHVRTAAHQRADSSTSTKKALACTAYLPLRSEPELRA